MADNNKKLKDYIHDDVFVEKMNRAFSDLRADYELSMDADEEKINELQETHVDVRNQLSDLVSYSLSSSGVVSGLRGTGKTHLLLLARNNINKNCYAGNGDGVFCTYLNVKRLSFPENLDQDLFNRIFSVFLYNEIQKQLVNVLKQLQTGGLIKKLLCIFDNDKHKVVRNLQSAIIKLMEFKEIAHSGNSAFKDLSIGTIAEECGNRELVEFATSLQASLNTNGAELGTEWSESSLSEVSKRLNTNNTYLNYLNTSTIRDELVSIMRLLSLKGITFYVDEWEKISFSPLIQRYLSFYIDRILDDPVYFWISVVPHRGELYHLDNGADLQHFIDLDENLVYENSSKDRELCLAYFRDFINKRLMFYFHDESVNMPLLFNNNQNFEQLVLASMGNSRDFGTMLTKCWSEFRSYRMGTMAPGRPFQFISERMVIASIKNNGEKKLSNISNNSGASKVWNNIETFCIGKKSSHFALEESRANIDNLSRAEFSDLIYHRLIHLRKRHVPAKELSVESKLSIYALSYSSTYNLHTNERKISFVTDYNAVNDRVRRYIYDPTEIINRIQIQEGEIFPCVSCGEGIFIGKMAAAWNNNSCPFCGGKIRKL